MNRMLVNGCASAVVPADDRGVLYGDGLFETLAFHQGRSALWPLHMARLASGCERLAIPQPDPDRLAVEARQVIDGLQHAIVRITVTRGQGGRAYRPPAEPEPCRVVAARAFPRAVEAHREAGISMISAPFPLQPAGPLAGIKHLNRLPQVLIARACEQAGADEALAVDVEGWLVEGLSGNLVIEREGQLIAPGPHPAAVAGVGLAWLRATAGAMLSERPVHREELRSDDAIWVLNSVQGFRPVARLDGQERPLGPTLRHWQQRWHDAVES